MMTDYLLNNLFLVPSLLSCSHMYYVFGLYLLFELFICCECGNSKDVSENASLYLLPSLASEAKHKPSSFYIRQVISNGIFDCL